MMADSTERELPVEDWLTQGELADLLHVSRPTACRWAAAGRLARFEHGFPVCGWRKYSRQLVLRELERCRRLQLDADGLQA